MPRLSHTRWSGRTFPLYAFVPGRNPHPTADPRGHSRHRRADDNVTCPPPDLWQQSEAYLFGCDLYNHGYWWEAHEAWESVWLTCQDPVQRQYLQGLIQAANAHLKLEMGRRNAVRRLIAAYCKHLTPIVETRYGYMGIALPTWLADLHRYHAHALDSAALNHAPAAYPYLHLSAQQDK